MNRRTFMIGAGGIGAATIGGLVLTSSAAAEVDTGLFSVENEHFNTNSGRMERLEIAEITVFSEWEGFEYPVETVEWKLAAAVNESDFETLGSAEVEFDEPDEYEGETSSSSIDAVDLVDVFGQASFEVDGDDAYEEDATEHFDVDFKLSTTVTDVDGNEVEESVTGDSNVGITNLGADVDVGGAGEIDGDEEDGSEYGPIETMDGVDVNSWPNPLTVTLTNTNSYPVVATVEWLLSGETKHTLEADEEKEVASPMLSESNVSSQAQSTADDEDDEFVGLVAVEEDE